MKVIFLDIDGVLNTAETFDRIDTEYSKTGIYKIEIDGFRVDYLSQIVDATEALIVLCSAWRSGFVSRNGKVVPVSRTAKQLVDIFNRYGVFIYDFVPKIIGGKRQDEIWMWLKNNTNVESFVILDDDSSNLMDFIGKNLIKTSDTLDGEMIKNMSQCTGLCKEHIEQAIEILNSRSYCRKLIK